MTEQFFISPAVEGARLHDPVTNEPLAAAGEMKPRTSYWLMCLNRGDVVEEEAPAELVADPAPAAPPPAPPAAREPNEPLVS